MATSLEQLARQLRANGLLTALLDDYQRQQVDSLCQSRSDDLQGLQRANIAWQTVNDLRSFLDERTKRYIPTED